MRPLFLAAGLSADGLLNAGVALIVGLSATFVAIGIAVYQRHQNKASDAAIAAERKRADDAVARLEAARIEELNRVLKDNQELRRQRSQD